MTETSRGRRIVTEVVVIVGSILLAFAIDAAWDGRGERLREHRSLAVLLADLEATTAQLDEFRLFVEDKSEATFAAFAALSGSVSIPDSEFSDLLARSYVRRTLRLPRAGLSELEMSGTIRSLRDPVLLAAILGFREQLEHSEAIIERNSTTFNDELLTKLLIEGGLVLPRVAETLNPSALVTAHRERFESLLGADFEFPEDPLFRLPPEAPEWQRLRSALLTNGGAAVTSAILAEALQQSAADLAAQIRVYLGIRDARPGP